MMILIVQVLKYQICHHYLIQVDRILIDFVFLANVFLSKYLRQGLLLYYLIQPMYPIPISLPPIAPSIN